MPPRDAALPGAAAGRAADAALRIAAALRTGPLREAACPADGPRPRGAGGMLGTDIYAPSPV